MRPDVLPLCGRYYRAHPIGDHLGYAEEVLQLELSRTVFLIIDVYGRGFDGDLELVDVPPLYRTATRDNYDIVVNHIVPAKRAAKELGIPIVYLSNYLSPGLNDRNEWRNLSLRVHGIDVLEAWQEPNEILSFSEIVAPQEGEYLIKKQLASGFFETHLDSLLRSLDAYNLVTVGFDSRICLATTVMDAMYRNYRVIALRDGIGTYEEPETANGRWANFLAVRWIETQVGYTSTAQQWVDSCRTIMDQVTP